MQQIIKPLFSLLLGAVVMAGGMFVVNMASQGQVSVVLAQDAKIIESGTATNPQLLFQGQLLNPATGQPVVNNAYGIIFTLYNAPSGGAPLWLESKQVNTTDGLFATMLGSVNPLNTDAFNGQQLYLGIAVAGDPEATPRQPLGYSAYALFADKADRLDGLDSLDFVRQGNGGLVAYGIVEANGSRVDGKRFSSRRASDGVYEITIDGENYELNKFITTVTVIDNSECSSAIIAKTGSGNGKLNVYLYNLSNQLAACKFHFLTLEP